MLSIAHSDLQIASITLSHVDAAVNVRELLAYQDWGGVMAEASGVREWAILSTCHRFELYFVAARDEMMVICTNLQRMLSNVAGKHLPLAGTLEDEPWHVRTDLQAVEHLCRVAAGLDSVVLGEAQIQGQVISTYTSALEAGTIGPYLSTLFRTAIRVGKRARTETQISAHALSMSSVALSMAAHWFPDFGAAKVLVIGAGEMSRLALKALLQRHVTDVTVVNRTLARASAALMHPAWRAVEWSQLADAIQEYDVIFAATSAPHFVVTREMLLRQQRTKITPQVLIDMAVPRDVEPSVRNLPHTVLIDGDELRQGIDDSAEKRKQALPAVHLILDEEVARWHSEQRELAMRPYVVELRQRAERIRQAEVERTMRFLGPVDPVTRDHIQHLSHALVNKLLHEPTVRIKELAHAEDAELYVSTLCDLFGLDTITEAQPNIQCATSVAASHSDPTYPLEKQEDRFENANVPGAASRR